MISPQETNKLCEVKRRKLHEIELRVLCDILNDQFRCLVLNFTEQLGIFLRLFDDKVTKGIIAEFNDFQMLAEALRMSVSHFFPSLESEAASKQRLIVAFPVNLLVFLFFFSVLIFSPSMQEKFLHGVCPQELSAGILSTNISWNGIGFQLFWFSIFLGVQDQ